MGAFLRWVANFMVAGALLGIMTMTFVYPRYKAWDNTPGQGRALCDCAETTRQTADGLISAQLTGGAAGAGVGGLLGVLLAFRRRKTLAAKNAALAAATPAPTPAKP